LDKVVSASRKGTIIETGIALNFVAVVASLNTLDHNSITATKRGAIVEATVRIDLIPVITSLVTFFASLQITTTNPVTATSG
jgi:hypothetical protein